jgi:hypothetical protein
MAENNELNDIARFADPSRRKFLLGLVSAAVATPTIISFVSNTVGSSASANGIQTYPGLWRQPFGNYVIDPSANWSRDPNANYLCNITSNYLPVSGNFFADYSGNWSVGAYADASGNMVYADWTGNFFYDPSANWYCDPSMNFVYNPTGNWTPLSVNTTTVAPTTSTAPTTTAAPTTTTAPTTTVPVGTESVLSPPPDTLPKTR